VSDRHPVPQHECRPANQDRRRGGGRDLVPVSDRNPGFPGRGREERLGDRFGRHGRRRGGGSSTAAKRRGKAKSEEGSGLQHGWGGTLPAVDPTDQRDASAPFQGDPSDSLPPWLWVGGGQVGGAPEWQPAVLTEVRASRRTTRALVRAKVQAMRRRVAHKCVAGATASSLTAALADALSPGEPGSSTLARGEFPPRAGALWVGGLSRAQVSRPAGGKAPGAARTTGGPGIGRTARAAKTDHGAVRGPLQEPLQEEEHGTRRRLPGGFGVEPGFAGRSRLRACADTCKAVEGGALQPPES
jgi:hypothetical protein